MAIQDGFGRSESKQLIAATNREGGDLDRAQHTPEQRGLYHPHAIQHTNPSEADTASRPLTKARRDASASHQTSDADLGRWEWLEFTPRATPGSRNGTRSAHYR
jgi:hypothetical protein